MILWLLAMLAVIGRGLFVLWRLRRTRIAGRIGPQEHRWRSDERFRFHGWTAATGCLIVPGLMLAITLVAVFAGAIFHNLKTGWNLAVTGNLILWLVSCGWLVRRL